MNKHEWVSAIHLDPIPPKALALAINNTGASITKIAKLIGVDRVTVHRWLAGSRALTGAQAKVARMTLLENMK